MIRKRGIAVMDNVEMIDDTEEARDEYGHLFGSSEHIITRSQVEELLNGKVMAMNDGEYVTFVRME